MKYQVDHDLHIHSNLSSCANDPEQTPLGILRYAQRVGLKQICLTNHYLDRTRQNADTPNYYLHQDYDHNAKALPLPQADGVEFLFGCENELRRDFTLGMPPERYDDFSFMIIPTTHMHMLDFTISRQDAQSNEACARLWVERLDAVLNMDLPFHKVGIAHLTCGLIRRGSRDNLLEILSMISQADLERLFTRAAQLGCGIEINRDDMQNAFGDPDPEICLRIYRTAKACGCKFYLGSDAHTQAEFEGAIEIFERAIDLLGLQESDKFRF